MFDGFEQTSGRKYPRDPEITGLTCDSRRIEPGYLFVALPGTQVDGRDFIADALARGAAAVLAPPGTRLPEPYGPQGDAGGEPGGGRHVPLINTENPRRRYALLAARFFGLQPKTVAAVTGTNGKTSTAAFLRQIWQHAGHAAASMGTLGIQAPGWNRPDGLTTPDPVDLHADLKRLADMGVDHLALEASSHGLDQARLDGVRIGAAGFTNLTRDHLDYHGSVEAYLAAKLRLFAELLADGGTAVVCADDPHADAVLSAARPRAGQVLTYGEAGRDIRLIDALPEARGLHLRLEIDWQRVDVMLPLVGRFQALNALCAIGLARATGVDTDMALAALEGLSGAPGRMELAGATANGAAVYVDYAHTPDALVNVLKASRPHTASKLHVVFGCGGDRDAGKRPEMGRAAAENADVVILTDDNPRTEDAAEIRRQARAGCPEALEIGDRREAIRAAIEGLAPGDLLVVAGKGHERGQIVGTETLPFDDAEEVRAALGMAEPRLDQGDADD